MKTCIICDEHKSLSHFGKNTVNKDGFSSQCKRCLAEKSKSYRKNNPDKVAATDKRRYEANRDKILSHKRQYHQNNPSKIASKNKRWYQNNRDKAYANSAKYRAAKLQATPPWLTTEHNEQMSLCYAEALALRLYTGQDYHVDHITPLQGKNVCGLHVPWNLQVLLACDNIRKSNKLLQG